MCLRFTLFAGHCRTACFGEILYGVDVVRLRMLCEFPAIPTSCSRSLCGYENHKWLFLGKFCHTTWSYLQLLFSFEQGVKVEMILLKTLACQPSSTFMQLLLAFDRTREFEKILVQTVACQLSTLFSTKINS